MTTENQPVIGKRQILKSVAIAIVIAAIVLITAILPAEYNIDPLGIGQLFGFSKLYVADDIIETDQNDPQTVTLDFKKLKLEKLGSPVTVPKPIEANNPAPINQYSEKNDTIQVIIPAGKGIEYKFKVLKYGSIKYDWLTKNNTIVYIDFHGEVKQDMPTKNVFYESYTLAYANNMAGTFTAPFEGKHGWYFRNDSKEPVTVTIRLKGEYELFSE